MRAVTIAVLTVAQSTNPIASPVRHPPVSVSRPIRSEYAIARSMVTEQRGYALFLAPQAVGVAQEDQNLVLTLTNRTSRRRSFVSNSAVFFITRDRSGAPVGWPDSMGRSCLDGRIAYGGIVRRHGPTTSVDTRAQIITLLAGATVVLSRNLSCLVHLDPGTYVVRAILKAEEPLPDRSSGSHRSREVGVVVSNPARVTVTPLAH